MAQFLVGCAVRQVDNIRWILILVLNTYLARELKTIKYGVRVRDVESVINTWIKNGFTRLVTRPPKESNHW
jgi:hypothetical protein